MSEPERKPTFPIVKMEDVSIGVNVANAIRMHVEDAGLHVPNGDLGFRCEQASCRRPVLPCPAVDSLPAHFEHLEANDECASGRDLPVTRAHGSSLLQSWLDPASLWPIARRLGGNSGGDRTSFVAVPRKPRPHAGDSSIALPEPEGEFE